MVPPVRCVGGKLLDTSHSRRRQETGVDPRQVEGERGWACAIVSTDRGVSVVRRAEQRIALVSDWASFVSGSRQRDRKRA